MSKTSKKDKLIAAASSYLEKPFFSKPTDARLRGGWLEIKHQASHELEPHWDQVTKVDQVRTELQHYMAKGDTTEVARYTAIIEVIDPTFNVTKASA